MAKTRYRGLRRTSDKPIPDGRYPFRADFGVKGKTHCRRIWAKDYHEANRLRTQMIAKFNPDAEAKRNTLTLHDAIEYFVSTVVKERKDTAQRYSRALGEFEAVIGGDKLVTRIGLDDYEVFKKVKLQKLSPATVNQRMNFVRAFFANLYEKETLTRNPAKKWKPLRVDKKIQECLSEKEIKQILTHIRRQYPQWYAFFCVIAQYGWRKMEVRRLRWDDVDFDRGVIRITISEQGKPKNRSEREHIMTNDVIEALKRQRQRIAKKHIKTKYVFCGRGGSMLRQNSPAEILKEICAELGIGKKITTKTFRHSVVTNLLHKGTDPETIKGITGHKDTKTIYTHYAHTDRKRIAEAMEAINPF